MLNKAKMEERVAFMLSRTHLREDTGQMEEDTIGFNYSDYLYFRNIILTEEILPEVAWKLKKYERQLADAELWDADLADAKKPVEHVEKRRKLAEAYMAQVGNSVHIRFKGGQFREVLGLIKSLGGKVHDSSNWTWAVPVNAVIENKAKFEELGFTVPELVPATVVAVLPNANGVAPVPAKVAEVRILFIDDNKIGIFHPYCDRMNAAYRNAEETSGIIGWNNSKKCRMVCKDDAHDLKEIIEVIGKIHPEWTIDYGFDLQAYYADIEAQKIARRKVTPEIMALLRDGMTPLPHQIEGYNYFVEMGGNALNGDDMGLGKTFQVLLYGANFKKRICVVGPKNVRRQWLEESQKFFKDGVWNGYEIDTSDDVNVDLSAYNLVTINYEILKKFKDAILRAGFTLITVDESHRIKNPKAQITQLVLSMAPSFPHKILLSGTPIKNKKKEIFTQANMVRPGTFQSMNQVAWMTTFQARETIKKFFYRRTKKNELPNLPPKFRSVVKISGKGLPDWKRGMQIGDQSALRSALARAKVPMTCSFVEEILEGSDSKVIIFTESDDAAQDIAAHFGEQAVIHVGSTPHEKREKHKAMFNDENNETVRVFVATTPSCREGVNLTIADKVVFNDLPWTPADLNQAEDRAWRIGQKAACVNVYWVCASDNRFDNRAVAILFTKMEIYKKFIDGKKPTEAEQKFLDTPIERLMLQSLAEESDEGEDE